MFLTIVKRLAYAALVILLVTISTVALMRLAPGSVAETILGESATKENVAALNAELGLDKPFLEQYLNWLGSALHGDFGVSPITGVPVSEAIGAALPVTLEIALIALIIALVTAIVLGVLSAAFPDSALDRGINGLTSVFLSVPAFVSGPILIYFLALSVHAFPVYGWEPLSGGLGPNLSSAILPAIAVSLTEIAAFHRVLRADLVSTLREDFITAARAKGMPAAYVMFRHAFRPSSFSLLTIAGLNLARLIGGTIVVETLFGLPGLGQLVATAITQRDIVTVQGIVVFIACIFVGINILVDISYGLVDPRVRAVSQGRKTFRKAPKAQKVVAA